MSASAELTTAGALAVAGAVVSLGALVVLHLVATGLSPITNPVSQYGITRYRAGYRVQTIGMGVAALACGLGVSRLALGGSLVVALFVVMGVSRLLISWFPMDHPGGELTRTGRRHGLLALVAFVAAAAAALRLGNQLERAHVWPGAGGALVAIGAVMTVALIGMAVLRSGGARRYFGLVERVFYVGALSMLLVVGSELIRSR